MTTSRKVAARRETAMPSRPGNADRPARVSKVLVIALFCLLVPVRLFTRWGVEFTPVDVLGPLLLAVLLISRSSGRHLLPAHRTVVGLLVISGFGALIAVLATSGSTGLTRQLASMVFTFRPLLYLLVGFALVVRTRLVYVEALKIFAAAASFGCIAIVAGLKWHGVPNYSGGGEVVSGGVVRVGEHLNGTYLELPLYGHYGVNSLAQTYAVFGCLSLAGFVLYMRAQPSWKRSAMLVFHLLGVAASGYLAETSNSRQALLLVVVTVATVAFVAFMQHFLNVPYRTVTTVIKSIAGALLLLGIALASYFIQQEGGLTHFTAGRDAIMRRSFARFWASPLTGDGFAEAPNGVSNNTHNLIMNLVTKMGLLGAIPLLLVLLLIVLRSLRRLNTGHATSYVLTIDLVLVLVIVVVGLISNAIDVVTAVAPLFILAGLLYERDSDEDVSHAAAA